MPIIYDFCCENCQVIFEVAIKSEEKIVIVCPECGSVARKCPVATKSYKINGDNSASVTPKKHKSSE